MNNAIDEPIMLQLVAQETKKRKRNETIGDKPEEG